MSLDTEPDASARPSRPASVDRAVYALIARCVFALAGAFALYGARSDVPIDASWAPATVHHHVNEYLRAYLISNLVYAVMVLILAKFIRDGRNWARWLYLEFAFFIPGDVVHVLGLFSIDHLLLRALSGLTGLAAIVALVLLFTPTAGRYLRKPGSQPALAGLLRPRRGTQVVAGPPAGAEQAVVLTKPAAKPGAKRNATRPGSVRPAAVKSRPRPKSRKPSAE